MSAHWINVRDGIAICGILYNLMMSPRPDDVAAKREYKSIKKRGQLLLTAPYLCSDSSSNSFLVVVHSVAELFHGVVVAGSWEANLFDALVVIYYNIVDSVLFRRRDLDMA